MTTTYRAAYFLSTDTQGEVVLTTETQSHLSDAELVAAAQHVAEDVGLDLSGGAIVIGDWRECE
jgi:hypothetical protein